MLEVTIHVPELSHALEVLAAAISASALTDDAKAKKRKTQQTAVNQEPTNTAQNVPTNTPAPPPANYVQQPPVNYTQPPTTPPPATVPATQAPPQQQLVPPPANVVNLPQATPPLTPPPPTAPTYKLEDLQRAGAALATAGRQTDLINLLAQFGVQSVMQLQDTQYGAFATALRGLGAQI